MPGTTSTPSRAADSVETTATATPPDDERGEDASVPEDVTDSNVSKSAAGSRGGCGDRGGYHPPAVAVGGPVASPDPSPGDERSPPDSSIEVTCETPLASPRSSSSSLLSSLTRRDARARERLSLLLHASECNSAATAAEAGGKEVERCSVRRCREYGRIWSHIVDGGCALDICDDDGSATSTSCPVAHCATSRAILAHFGACVVLRGERSSAGATPTCGICGPIWEEVRGRAKTDQLDWNGGGEDMGEVDGGGVSVVAMTHQGAGIGKNREISDGSFLATVRRVTIQHKTLKEKRKKAGKPGRIGTKKDGGEGSVSSPGEGGEVDKVDATSPVSTDSSSSVCGETLGTPSVKDEAPQEEYDGQDEAGDSPSKKAAGNGDAPPPSSNDESGGGSPLCGDNEDLDFDPNFVHARHRCDGCQRQPIVGFRYHAVVVRGSSSSPRVGGGSTADPVIDDAACKFSNYDLCHRCYVSWGRRGGWCPQNVEFRRLQYSRDCDFFPLQRIRCPLGVVANNFRNWKTNARKGCGLGVFVDNLCNRRRFGPNPFARLSPEVAALSPPTLLHVESVNEGIQKSLRELRAKKSVPLGNTLSAPAEPDASASSEESARIAGTNERPAESSAEADASITLTAENVSTAANASTPEPLAITTACTRSTNAPQVSGHGEEAAVATDHSPATSAAPVSALSEALVTVASSETGALGCKIVENGSDSRHEDSVAAFDGDGQNHRPGEPIPSSAVSTSTTRSGVEDASAGQIIISSRNSVNSCSVGDGKGVDKDFAATSFVACDGIAVGETLVLESEEPFELSRIDGGDDGVGGDGGASVGPPAETASVNATPDRIIDDEGRPAPPASSASAHTSSEPLSWTGSMVSSSLADSMLQTTQDSIEGHTTISSLTYASCLSEEPNAAVAYVPVPPSHSKEVEGDNIHSLLLEEMRSTGETRDIFEGGASSSSRCGNNDSNVDLVMGSTASNVQGDTGVNEHSPSNSTDGEGEDGDWDMMDDIKDEDVFARATQSMGSSWFRKKAS